MNVFTDPWKIDTLFQDGLCYKNASILLLAQFLRVYYAEQYKYNKIK
jgi:hypothetical protein